MKGCYRCICFSYDGKKIKKFDCVITIINSSMGEFMLNPIISLVPPRGFINLTLPVKLVWACFSKANF